MSLTAYNQLQAQIHQTASIAGNQQYWMQSQEILGSKKVSKAAISTSQIIEVGQSPNGFGKGVIWDRLSDGLLLALFVNAADPLGVSISGLAATDHVTLLSAAGIASFSEDKGNPLVSSIIAVIDDVVSGILKATGAGAVLSPLVDAGAKFAENQFKPSNVKTKKRDAYGIDPGTGAIAREEGGVLITLPAAGGPYYSGDGDHKTRWIQVGNSRSDALRPPQVVHGYFPVQNADNSRIAGAAGDVYITPWDWKFDDNAGYYKIIMAVSKAPLS